MSISVSHCGDMTSNARLVMNEELMGKREPGMEAEVDLAVLGEPMSMMREVASLEPCHIPPRILARDLKFSNQPEEAFNFSGPIPSTLATSLAFSQMAIFCAVHSSTHLRSSSSTSGNLEGL